MYRNVLVATDGSREAGAAGSRAIELADQFDATLTAIFVVDRRLGRTTATKEPYRQAGESALEGIERAAARRDVPVTTRLTDGQPADAIVDYAESHGIDLIVVGGKNKSTTERIFIGDTAEKVVRYAPMSVLIVRDEAGS